MLLYIYMSVFGVLRAVEGFETGTALLEGSNVNPLFNIYYNFVFNILFITFNIYI